MGRKKKTPPAAEAQAQLNPMELMSMLGNLKGKEGGSSPLGGLGGLGDVLKNMPDLKNTGQNLHDKLSKDASFTDLVTKLTTSPEIKGMADEIANKAKQGDILSHLKTDTEAKKGSDILDNLNIKGPNLSGLNSDALGKFLEGATTLAKGHANYLEAQSDLIRHSIEKEKAQLSNVPYPFQPEFQGGPPPPLNLNRYTGGNGPIETIDPVNENANKENS